MKEKKRVKKVEAKQKASPKRRKGKKGPEKNDDVNDEDEEDDEEQADGRVTKRPVANSSLAMVAAGVCVWECRTLVHKMKSISVIFPCSWL